MEHLLEGSNKGKLARGELKNAAAHFSCSYEQVTGVWKRYQQQKEDGVDVYLRNGRLGHSGRRGTDVESAKEALKDIPKKNRTTIRALASQLGMANSTLKRNLSITLACARRLDSSSRASLTPAKNGGWSGPKVG